MAVSDIADQYFTYDSRLSSFQTSQSVSKRRASNASTKAGKALKWPHKILSIEELAKAGFFYYPTPGNPDNVACFLCHKALDGWEEDDDPLAEHLKHSPDCGWATVAAIEKQDIELSQEYPMSQRMIEARKATFADKWPHEGKKGWKCKIRQMVDSGWKYTPTMEGDDMATCTYCFLALDGWEPSDKPMDEHFSRSSDCPFFALINNPKQTPKRPKSKRDRASKASRLSTQSAFTVASDAQSVTDLPAEDEDSILTTATNATATQGKKMGKTKKATATKGRKTRAKKAEPVEVVAPEPEDADFEVKVEEAKPSRGKKRKSEQEPDIAASATDVEAPPPKRRATRTRGSMVVDESLMDPTGAAHSEVSKPVGRKGRLSTRSTRKASAASMVALGAPMDDEEIDKALEADLERRLSGDEEESISTAPPKKSSSSNTVVKADHAMFGVQAMEIDDAAIEAELDAMDVDLKRLPKAKGAKGKQSRKPSAKQQAAAKKAAEAEAEAQNVADEDEASQQMAAELEHSISMQHSSPVVQQKKQRASSRPLSRQMVGRATRGSVRSTNDNFSVMGDYQESNDDQKDDSGHETDASMASQSTVVRGGASRRGSTMKKSRGGKKAATRNIEEIVHKSQPPVTSIEVSELSVSTKGKRTLHVEEVSISEEVFYTPVPEMPPPATVEPAQKLVKSKAGKGRGRAPNATPETASQPAEKIAESAIPEEPSTQNKATPMAKTSPPVLREPTPPPMEATPSQSPQSSDAENHPPSSKPSAATKKTATPHSTAKRIPLAATTPQFSPSKRNVIAGLQSLHPWTAVDLETIFLKSPNGEHDMGIFGGTVDKLRNGDLSSPEKRMSVEEWIHHNAQMAEDKLKNECERMVGAFESEGTRAMRALEGVECVE